MMFLFYVFPRFFSREPQKTITCRLGRLEELSEEGGVVDGTGRGVRRGIRVYVYVYVCSGVGL